MTTLTSAAVRDARRRWQADRGIIAAIAGPFLFLPVFAWLLLVQEPVAPAGASRDQQLAIVLDWLVGHLPWLAMRVGFELFATLAILSLYLARDHRDVRGLLLRALTALPLFAVAVMCSWGLVMAGFLAFVLPSLYVYGRVALTGPALVAEPELGLAGAIARSVALTRGNGWRVFATLAIPLLGGYLALQVIGAVDQGLRAGGDPSPVARATIDALAALVATASGLARVLLQVALYRRLASPRHAV